MDDKERQKAKRKKKKSGKHGTLAKIGLFSLKGLGIATDAALVVIAVCLVAAARGATGRK